MTPNQSGWTRIIGLMSDVITALSDELDEAQRRDEPRVTYWPPTTGSKSFSSAAAPRLDQLGKHEFLFVPKMATGKATADPLCGAVAIPCMPWDQPGACPREAHEHPACTGWRNHTGRHTWQVEAHDNREASDPHTPPPITFAIPGRPPTGSKLRDKVGGVWQCHSTGHMECVNMPTDAEPRRYFAEVGDHLSWAVLLNEFGPVTLLPDDQDQADKDLYGPRGARWGNPDVPCPFFIEGDDTTVSCRLGLEHAGPHRDAHGNVIVPVTGQSFGDSLAQVIATTQPQAEQVGEPDCPHSQPFEYSTGAVKCLRCNTWLTAPIPDAFHVDPEPGS